MSDEGKKPNQNPNPQTDRPFSERETNLEKGGRTELNENKLPDFQFTPPPPPPPSQDNSDSGSGE